MYCAQSILRLTKGQVFAMQSNGPLQASVNVTIMKFDLLPLPSLLGK